MYDSAATMFSPDGRIYQVEYAREAVKRGTTAVGVAYAEGAVLLVDKRISSKLIEAHAVEKIFKIDRHIGCASSGLVGDARMLVARARAVAANNRVTYNESVEVNVLVKDLSDIMQAYTQNGGVRPFGAAFLIAGIDPDGTVRLYETDPSGAVVAYKASAIGVGRSGCSPGRLCSVKPSRHTCPPKSSPTISARRSTRSRSSLARKVFRVSRSMSRFRPTPRWPTSSRAMNRRLFR